MGGVHAPWTPDQVAALYRWQRWPMVHPFTADHRNPDGSEIVLIPTRDGWIETPGGPVVQTWAHDSMLTFPDGQKKPGWATEIPERKVP